MTNTTNTTTTTTASQRALGLASLALLSALGASGCAPGGQHAPAVYAPGASVPVRAATTLESARADHAISAIGTGLVLVTGGETLSAPVSDTAELVDARSGACAALGARLTAARAGHVQVTLPSGDVLLAGGRGSDGRALDSLEVFHVASGTFSALPERLLAPRDQAVAALTSGRLVIAGGVRQASLEVWSLAPLAPQGRIELPGGPRVAPDLVHVRGDLYFLYGGEDDPAPLWIDVASGEVTPATGELVRRATAIRAPGEEAVWLVGGLRERDVNRIVQRVAPEQEPRFVVDGPQQRRERPVVTADALGTVSVFGGRLNGFAVSEAEQLAPSAQPLPPLPGERERPAAAVLEDEGVIVLVGGRGADGRPTPYVDLILPPGAVARDGEASYRAASAGQQQDAARAGDLARAGANLGQARGDRDQVQGELTAVSGELAGVRQGIDRLELDLSAAKAGATKAEEEARESAALLQTREQELAATQANASASAAQLSAAKTRATNARNNAAQDAQQAADLRARVDSLEQQLAAARARQAELTVRQSTLQAQL
ncbi:MAG: kelch repeat-containing protein [Planctomycetota bacterium]